MWQIGVIGDAGDVCVSWICGALIWWGWFPSWSDSGPCAMKIHGGCCGCVGVIDGGCSSDT